jgi:hypothetical protein
MGCNVGRQRPVLTAYRAAVRISHSREWKREREREREREVSE